MICGCTCPGELPKGFGGGADFVMLGGMLAGHDEGNGKIVKVNGEKYIEFYGSSFEVNKKNKVDYQIIEKVKEENNL